MRVATFNLENLDLTSDAEVGLDDRIPILRPQLERLDADILCLQEVNGQHVKGIKPRVLLALDKLLAGTRYASYERATTPAKSGAGVADVHNLVTLSRWPIKDTRAIRHQMVPPMSYRPLTAEPPSAKTIEITFERPILIADIEAPGGHVITVVNVHFRAPLAAPVPGQKESAFVWKSVKGWAEGYTLAAWKRTAQALEARLAIDAVMDADPERLIIVAGDFNAEDHETPLKIVAGAEEDTGNGLLAQRSLVILDRSLPADRRFSILHLGRGQMVDHILASRPALARFRGLEVHNETLADEIVSFGKIRREAGSLHAPVVAQFALPD